MPYIIHLDKQFAGNVEVPDEIPNLDQMAKALADIIWAKAEAEYNSKLEFDQEAVK